MTDNAVVMWDPNSGAALPAYLSDAMGDMGSNIQDRMMVPSLSYEGKTWTLIKDGNKTKLQGTNSDGDVVPISVMRMVILNYNPDRGRAYYPGVYNPAESKQPECWSADGKTPDPNSKNRQAATCQGCPMSVKGSKVQDGKEMVACSSHRMIAIAPADGLTDDPFRLKIAVTSDYDKETVEHGWFAFRQYADFLKSRGISHTAMVVTKVKFDPNTAYPKLLFSLDRLLSQAEVAQVKIALKNPKVGELLAEKWSAAGKNGTDMSDSDIRPYGLEGAYADGWTPHPDASGYSYKGSDVVDNETLAARYPAPPPPAVPTTPEPAALHGLPAAEADGWIAHPSAPGYHYKGDVVEATDKVAALYPPPATPEPAAPPPPPVPAAPPAPPPVTHDPHAAALADGWVQHPNSEPHGYKGQEVLDWPTIHAKYPGNAASAPDVPASAPPAVVTSDPASPAPTGTGEVPPEIQGLLNKWS